MSLTDDNKIDNLWKKSRGVVDIEKEAAYYDVAQKPFVENILNKDIFSKEVPDEIPGQLINVSGFGQISKNSVIGLDDTFHSAGVASGKVPSTTPVNQKSNVIGYEGFKLSSIGYPHLTYYHRIPLREHPTSNKTKPDQLVKTTWYIPDPTNPELSALRYSINFKKGGFRHYEQRFYANTTNPNPIEIKEGFSPHLMVFDNKSGYVLLYGDDSAFNWKISSASTGSTGPLLMSFIRYEGPLGASGASLDASFNNVDISENLISEDTDLIQVATLEIQRPPPGVPPSQYWTQVSIGSRNYNLASADPSPNIYGYYLIAECDFDLTFHTVNLGFFEIEVIQNNVPRTSDSGNFKFNSKFYLGINGYRTHSSSKGEVIFHAIRSTFDDYKNSPVKKIILVFDDNDKKYKVYIHFDYNINDYGLIKFQQTGSNDINVVSSWNKLFERNGLDTLDKKLRFQVRITSNDSNKTINYEGSSYDNAWKIKNFDFDNTLSMNEIPGQPSTGNQTSETMYEYDMSTRITEEGIRTRNVLVAENELYVQGYNLIKKWEKQAPNFPSNYICQVYFTKDSSATYYYDKNYAAANAMVYLRLNYNLNSSNSTSAQAVLVTQEVLFNVSYVWSNRASMDVKGNINILSQHCTNFPSYDPASTIIKSLEIVKDNSVSSNPTKVLLYCQCNYDSGINRNNVECYVEIYNNRDNRERSTVRPGPANYWAGNSNFSEGYGTLNSYTTIDKVELVDDITSGTITFKSKRLGTNKLILTKDTGFYTANSNANCPSITENENILHTNYKHTAVKDYSNNLILNAEHGNVIINVKDPDYVEGDDGGVQANYGGLKIFNSGPAVNLGNGFIEPPAPMIELVSQNGRGNGLASGTNTNGLPYGSAKIYTNSEKNTIIEGAGHNLLFNTGWAESQSDPTRISFNLRGDTITKDSRVLLANRDGSTGKIEFTINEGIDNTDTIIFTPKYNRNQSGVDKPYAFKVDSSMNKIIVKTDLDVGSNRPYIRDWTNPNVSGQGKYNVVAGHTGYRNTKINSYPDSHGQLTDRAYVQEVVVDLSGVGSLEVVDDDWVTIAKTGIFGIDVSGNGDWECIERNDFRANAIFEITDKTGSHHHHIKFIANAFFDKISLKVLSNQYYVRNRFTAVRIVAAGTYEGNVLQVKIRCPSVSNGAASITGYDSLGRPIYDPYNGQNVTSMNIKVWQNTNDSGWVVNENLIEKDNNPTVYSKNNGVPVSNFGQPYASLGSYSESIVYVDQNKEIGSTFKEDFLNGVLIKGGLNMTGGDIEDVDEIQAKTYTRSTTGQSIDIGGASQTNKHFTWFREPTRIYANNNSTTVQYLDDIGFEAACMFNNDDGIKAIQINRTLHNGVANFPNATSNQGGGYAPNINDSKNILSSEIERKQFALTSPFKETVLVSLVARNTATNNNNEAKTLKQGSGGPYSGDGVIGMDVTAGHLQFQAGYPGFDISSTTQNGNPTVAGLCYAPYDLYIKKVVSRHYSYTVDVNNTTNASRSVRFETYIAYGPSDSPQHPLHYTYDYVGVANPIFPTNQTCPSHCGLRGKRVPFGTPPLSITTPGWTGGDKSLDHGNFLIASHNRTFGTGLNSGTGATLAYRTAPFHTATPGAPSGSGVDNWKYATVFDIANICGKPIKIPKGSHYGIYLVERRSGTWGGSISGKLEFTTYSNVQGGFASVPVIYEIFGEMNMSS